MLSNARSHAKVLWHRIYADFLMPDRLGIYENLLRTALEHSYELHSIHSFWQRIRDGAPLPPTSRYLILRHDVDTDASTAARMWAVERKLGVKSTFYFRLSTLAPNLMRAIQASGSEASYHYEELATIARRISPRNADQICAEMSVIRQLFKANLFRLRRELDLPLLTVASHGDFMNRRLGVTNTVILADQDFRKEVGIELEAYDAALNEQITDRFADRQYPEYWSPSDPVTAIRRGSRTILILTHPRQWRAAPAENAVDDMIRLWHGARYFVASHRFWSTEPGY